MLETPVLLIAFRRPDTTRKVLEAIRQVAPTRLFVACDGPRKDKLGEKEACLETRRVIEQEIDWPCNILKLYRDENLGCRNGVSSAITWFFEHVEEGIILEDDCVAHPTFFSYCQTLLDWYRSDTRVWCISGDNFQDGQWRGDGSYYFSRYPHCWGWATWKRAWQHYDAELSTWPLAKSLNILSSVIPDPLELEAWISRFDHLLNYGQLDTWDYIWTYSCWVNNGLTALPNVNLVQNIGFDIDATHTTQQEAVHRSIPAKQLSEIKHPSFVIRDEQADAYTFEHFLGGAEQRRAHNNKNDWMFRQIYRGRGTLSRIKRSLFC